MSSNITGAKEVLTHKRLQEWLRERPDSFLGPIDKVATVRLLVGTRDSLRRLSPHQPITCLPEREVAALQRKQILIQDVVGADGLAEGEGEGEREGEGGDDGNDGNDEVDDAVDAVDANDDEDNAGGAGGADGAGGAGGAGGACEGATDVTALAVVVAPPPSTKKKSAALTMKDVASCRLAIEYSPGAEKIVDEIFQNMIDRTNKDDKMRRIDVVVDEERGLIRARNDGCGMLVEKPDRAANPSAPDALWPTILFTEIMAGGNFVEMDGMEHHQGGRNGVGAKATNVCSKRFRVTVGDIVNKRHFVQEWTNGMKDTTGPVVKKYNAKLGFVEIEFEPDMAFFGYPEPGFTPAFAALVRSRAWELAGNSPDTISVWLDGMKLPVHNFTQFTSVFFPPDGKTPRPARSTVSTKHGVVWDLSVLPAEDGMPADCIAFVNGVRCCAGKHVQHVYSKLATLLEDAVAKKMHVKKDEDKKDLVAPSAVKSCVFVVLSTRINGPRFTNQSKDALDTPVKDWGFRWEPDEAFVKRVGVLCADRIAEKLMIKTEAVAVREASKKTGGSRSVNMAKYEPAGDAGRPNTAAMLLLAEGDSAKEMAMSGRAVTGSALIGVYCLKGKPMNPRNVDRTKAMANVVLNALAKILNLEYDKTYNTEEELKRLNYRHLILLADQDFDGGHIVGLVYNWVETLWPCLLRRRPDFIKRFATPIVIATRKGRGGAATTGAAGAGPQTVQFLSTPTFKAWLEEDPARKSQYTVQYFKGLGGHTEEASRRYFESMDDYMVSLMYDELRDHETLLDFFDSKRTDARKLMLTEKFREDACVDYSLSEVTITDYLMNETLPYSHDHNIRNIPAMDGLKRTGRKIVYAVRKTLGKKRRGAGGGKAGADDDDDDDADEDGGLLPVPVVSATGAVAAAKRKLAYRSPTLVKLQTLAMEAAKKTYYHHGDASLYSTTVGLAQQHVGTNNINLLACGGSFGSRCADRGTFAAPRYLLTGLQPIANMLFRPEDDGILTYRIEDGTHRVEPVVFAPVVPIDLINGCSGVGTGWRTEIPSFNPEELIGVFERRVRGDAEWRSAADDLMPWYDCFTGPIEASDVAWYTYGLYHLEEGTTTTNVVISELPVGVWSATYFSTVLEPLLVNSEGTGPKFIERILSDSTNARVRYTLVCNTEALYAAAGSERLEPFDADGRGLRNSADQSILDQARDVYARKQARYPKLEAVLGLVSSTTWTQMHRFDLEGHIVNYKKLSDIVDAYYHFRLPLYQERLDVLIREHQRQAFIIENKLRFIRAVMADVFTVVVTEYVDEGEVDAEGQAVLTAVQKTKFKFDNVAAWWQELDAMEFAHDRDPRILAPRLKTVADLPQLDADDDEYDDGGVGNDGEGNDGTGGLATRKFTYLTSTPMSRMTGAQLRALEQQLEMHTRAADALAKTVPSHIWLEELDELRQAYNLFMTEKQRQNRVNKTGAKGTAVVKRRRQGAAPSAAKRGPK